jgi:hypothetical protein
MTPRIFIGLPLAALTAVAGCNGGATETARVVATTTSASQAAGSCQTKDLSLSLGPGEGAAGSVYEPLRFTNKATTTCTLYGYPGVSFVTAGSGDQVGAAASRNPQHSAATVTLAPGATAESVVQVVNRHNYSPSQCKARDVSGFRVYPPDNKAAAYVRFEHASKACSTNVTQLTAEAVTTRR